MHYRFTDLLADESVNALCYPEQYPGHGPVIGMHILTLDGRPGERSTISVPADQSAYMLCFELMLRPSGTLSGWHVISCPGPVSGMTVNIRQPCTVILIQVDGQFADQLIALDFPEFAQVSIGRRGKTFREPAKMPVTPAMGAILFQLTQVCSSGCLKQLLFQSRIMEVMHLQIEQFSQAQHRPFSSSLKSYDIEKIHYACRLVEENIRTPCSLIELAHKAGLNDFKLKKGFKEVIGNTVFGYLFGIRMERARELLIEGKPVGEVAWETGYKNPHHFTAAFKKKFGFLPSQLNRDR